MNRLEMAEWLAETVLGWEHAFYGDGDTGHWLKDGERIYLGSKLIINRLATDDILREYFFSPDGFFAVIKAIPVEDLSINQLALIAGVWENFFVNQDYEAFYNTVYEALK